MGYSPTDHQIRANCYASYAVHQYFKNSIGYWKSGKIQSIMRSSTESEIHRAIEGLSPFIWEVDFMEQIKYRQLDDTVDFWFRWGSHDKLNLSRFPVNMIGRIRPKVHDEADVFIFKSDKTSIYCFILLENLLSHRKNIWFILIVGSPTRVVVVVVTLEVFPTLLSSSRTCKSVVQ
jgi:hypothetical protein